jgi:hypothetical protein
MGIGVSKYGTDMSGLAADIPSNAVAGDTYYATDTDAFYVSKGDGTWSSIGGSGSVTNAELADKDRVWAMAVLGTWAIDGDGVATNGAGMAGCVVADLTLTEAASTFCKSYDGTNAEFQDLATSSAGADMTNDYQFFSDTKADNDAVYFGGAVPFCEMAIDMSATVQNYTGDALTWEYYNGTTWATLTLVYDGTDATAQDGLRSFGRDGAISFIPPATWASSTVDSQAAYWIRARISTTANIGANEGQTNSVEHKIVTPDSGFVCPQDGSITSIRLIDGASTLHTTADVKFILMNFTTGAHSGELTFGQDRRGDTFAVSGGLAVNDGDILGVLVTQEDGTAEVTNAVLELAVTIS